jgi:hypothetical protein
MANKKRLRKFQRRILKNLKKITAMTPPKNSVHPVELTRFTGLSRSSKISNKKLKNKIDKTVSVAAITWARTTTTICTG